MAGDPDAYLGLDRCPTSPNNSYVDFDDSGHLAVEMSEDNPTEEGGQGVNSDSFTWFDDVFQICNQGKQPVSVWIEAEASEEADKYFDSDNYGEYGPVTFYLGDDDEEILSEDNPQLLQVGECLCVGIRVVTKGLKEGQQLVDDDEIVIHADADQELATGPVTNQTQGTTHDDVHDAIDAAKDNDTIKVYEDQSGLVEVDKQLNIVGVGMPTLEDGVNITADNVRVSSFNILDSGDALWAEFAVRLEPGVSGITIEDNSIESDWYAIADESSAQTTSDVTIENNDIFGTAESGVQVVYINGEQSGPPSAEDAENINLIDNTIGANDLDGGLLVGLEADGGEVSGNTFDDPPTDYGHLELWGPNLEVEDNDFFGDNLGTNAFYVRNSDNTYTLSEILGANTFDPTAEVVGDDIRPE
ncbi:right-handed parallel beta-helix repeat-containing protein [Natrialba swarupiae]|uniref:right-handed parallel beta-helix repeat-containing protein n=1 Tax=Natrialba swarupiae TaxID=2448032 RepID=UPI001391C88C|nr:right-handed parallel beta-helix repeat-containing protein [Natrialba swarupiae]